MQTYILIAGAWHNSWYWKLVKEKLEVEGHRVIAVDLPGHGENRTSLTDQNLESYARYVVSLVEQQSEPVILVGHSMAGAIVCQVAEYKPEKIKTMIVLCGFLLNDGESINGLQDGYKSADWLKMAEFGVVTLSPDQKISYINPQVAREKFYGNMNDELVEQAVYHLGGEAIAAQYQTVKLGENFRGVSKVYIKTLQDRMLPLELQDEMSQRGVEKIYSIHSGHSPFLTASRKLADILLEIGVSVKGSIH